uniref:Uncharacterized protein n=1 Tax=Musa acuminata subsp. malaccensis TaxID=214687 RepID=A0A804JG82_MUSAM
MVLFCVCPRERGRVMAKKMETILLGQAVKIWNKEKG